MPSILGELFILNLFILHITYSSSIVDLNIVFSSLLFYIFYIYIYTYIYIIYTFV